MFLPGSFFGSFFVNFLSGYNVRNALLNSSVVFRCSSKVIFTVISPFANENISDGGDYKYTCVTHPIQYYLSEMKNAPVESERVEGLRLVLSFFFDGHV